MDDSVVQGKTKPFALAEVSLTGVAVRWRDHVALEAAKSAMAQRCTSGAMDQ